MRKRIVLVVVTLAGLAGAGVWAYPREARCGVCDAKLECWSSSICGYGCACAQNDPGSPGHCTSVAP